MKAQKKAPVAAVVETEIRSLRAAKAHTTRWLNKARREMLAAHAAINTLSAMITGGDNTDMTWVSLAQAREAQLHCNRRVLLNQQDLIKIDNKIAELIEYGIQYEQRKAAEGGDR